MGIVFEILLPVFALVGLGLLLRKRDIVPQDKWPGIEQVCFWLFFSGNYGRNPDQGGLKQCRDGSRRGGTDLANRGRRP